MRFPDSLPPATFLSDYWQKSALNMPGALPNLAPAIEPGELAWLATLPDVESRLVFTEQHGGRLSYRVDNGHFVDAQLASLPPRNWTLLVQDVDKHLPAFRAQFAPFSFVPDWRIDDLMISIAAPGGSVGPHSDNYDVFLCQGQGSRNWRLAAAGDAELDPESQELSLLKPFAAAQEYVAVNGDVLYLPPQVPHWGIARDLCVTYSVGMRAPNEAELHAACERLFPDLAGGPRTGATSRFYRDPDLHLDEAIPGLISAAAIERVRNQQLLPDALTHEQVAMVLGEMATDPKAWLAPERPTRREATQWLHSNTASDGIKVHGMARIAFCAAGDTSIFFANGHHHRVSQRLRQLVEDLCATRALDGEAYTAALANSESAACLEWMARLGTFDMQNG